MAVGPDIRIIRDVEVEVMLGLIKNVFMGEYEEEDDKLYYSIMVVMNSMFLTCVEKSEKEQY